MKQAVAGMILLAVCSYLPAVARAEDTTAVRHRVALDVACQNDSLRTQIISFVSRELRSLRDVDITDDNPSFKISIVAIAVALKSGYEAGYAFSIVVTSPLGDWSWALAKDLKPESKAVIAKLLAEQESLEDHRLLVGSFDNLRQDLTRFIAKFDTDKLEPRRRWRQQLKDSSR